MKRVIMLFMSLFFLLCFTGCGKSQEKINVYFIIDGKSYLVQIDKGISISKEYIPLNNDYEIVELYYDENMENKYNNEIINEDLKIYVKKNSIEYARLNEEIIKSIKKSYILYYCNKEISLDEIKIEEYYGQYNSYYAILIKELNKGDTGELKEVVIAGLTFKYPFSNREILLWKESKFVSLCEGYEEGIIQINDLIKIYEIFNS